MIILVDQDGPLADFEQGFLDIWRNKHPQEIFITIEQRTTFYMRDQYPRELRTHVDKIYSSSGFYENLPPVTGAVEALNQMLAQGIEVRICTSPLTRYEHCVLEKYRWVERHLGYDFTKRIIMTKDKTLVRGDFLIDDNPAINGIETPQWEHIIYDYAFNRNIVDKRRLTWQNWQQILLS